MLAANWLAALGALVGGPPVMPRKRGLLFVDPCEYERALLVDSCARHGIECVELWSEPLLGALAANDALPAGALERARARLAPEAGAETAWASRELGDLELLGVLCGSDAGLASAERLQHALVPRRSNGIQPARRDKRLMNEALAEADLPVAAQCATSDWAEAEHFLRSLGSPLRAVLKPRRGQSGMRVGLATSIEGAKGMWSALRSERVSLDEDVPAGALLQECLVGDEWVVDTCTADGEHKAVALWRYQKGAANGAPFVYFCDELRPMAGEAECQIVQYALGALDALGWRWGPAHTELKMTEDGPRLIEVNAGRFNGIDFKSIVDVCVGASQSVCGFL